MIELGNIDKINEDELLPGEGGIITLPRELENAPEEVKQQYIRWVEFGIQTKNDKNRIFSFISNKGAIEQVDAMGIPGQAVNRAVKKGITDADLPRLKDLCVEMEAVKKQKLRLKLLWLKWVRQTMGSTVFDWRKADLIELYSKYATHEEVKLKLIEWGYDCAVDQLYKFFLRNKETIDKKRLEFISSSRDHYLATDAGRMETLAMLHSKFISLFQNIASGLAPNQDELRKLSQEIRAIVEQARKEIKGDEIKLTIDGKIDINASIQASQTIQDISRKIPINMIPVYLVAAKMGINPNNILTSLTNSFYKDFNGFQKLRNKNDPPHTMDLIRNYDWNEIAQYHAMKPIEDNSFDAYEEIPFVEQPKIQTKRDKLKALISNQMEGNE